jgi:hypothetical protein
MTTVSGSRSLFPLDGMSGPAPRISRTKAASIVSAVMSQDIRSRVNLKALPRRRRLPKFAWLAAASFVIPVTVAAGVVRFVGARRPAGLLVSAALTPSSLTEPKTPARSITAVAPERAAIVPSVDEVAPPVELAPAPAPVEAPVEKPRAVDAPPRGKVAAPLASRTKVAEATPLDMLQKANDLRAQRQWLAAMELYEKTLRTFPTRPEAYSASVAAGVLRLDQLGDPKGALALFQSAVRARPRGSLSEEARWGAIQSYRVLGDSSSERHALQEFLTLHPQSLLAWRAQARLRELGGER